MAINRDFLFENARAHLFDGRISPLQKSGIEAILDRWERSHSRDDDRWLAYMLGTVHHETGRAMMPVRETFANSSEQVLTRLERSFSAGKLTWVREPYWRPDSSGRSWYGRGLVQITHRSNYEKMENELRIPLSANPDLALDLPVAIEILFVGMLKGLFTGRSLRDYFLGSRADWRGARRIINGLERADLVASYAKSYYSCISYTTGA